MKKRRRKKVTRKRKPGPKKRKSTTKKKSTTTSTSTKTGSKKKTKSKTKKRKTKGKRKVKGRKKGKKRQKKKEDKEKSDKGESTIGPGLSIYGDVNDLDFYGDEEMYVNPIPSTSSTAKPVNTIVPADEPVNLLASLIACQKSFLAPTANKAATSKMKEVYTKPEMDKDERKAISTSISRYLTAFLKTLGIWMLAGF